MNTKKYKYYQFTNNNNNNIIKYEMINIFQIPTILDTGPWGGSIDLVAAPPVLGHDAQHRR